LDFEIDVQQFNQTIRLTSTEPKLDESTLGVFRGENLRSNLNFHHFPACVRMRSFKT
ncbi:hypothetical protein J6590_104018, partial [Homalodisca vitripennis]